MLPYCCALPSAFRSLCTSRQHLRRAMELVAEMHSRGIACNVHTYSALMNVCVKCNEPELALDVLQVRLRITNPSPAIIRHCFGTQTRRLHFWYQCCRLFAFDCDGKSPPDE